MKILKKTLAGNPWQNLLCFVTVLTGAEKRTLAALQKFRKEGSEPPFAAVGTKVRFVDS